MTLPLLILGPVPSPFQLRDFSAGVHQFYKDFSLHMKDSIKLVQAFKDLASHICNNATTTSGERENIRKNWNTLLSIILQLVDQQVLFLQLCMQCINVIIMFTLQLPTHVHNVIELLDHNSIVSGAHALGLCSLADFKWPAEFFYIFSSFIVTSSSIDRHWMTRSSSRVQRCTIVCNINL